MSHIPDLRVWCPPKFPLRLQPLRHLLSSLLFAAAAVGRLGGCAHPFLSKHLLSVYYELGTVLVNGK